MTTSAPAARSFAAFAAIAGPSGATRNPCTLAARVDLQRIDRHDADDADLDAGRLDEHRRPHVRPLDRPARRIVNQVRREEGIVRLGGARFERAARIARQLSRRRRVDRSEIEIVVADGLRGIPHRVVGVDDEGAFAEIRLDAALKRVAGVDQQDRPAVRCPGRAQIVHVSREQGQTADPVSRKGRPVEIAGPDNRQRHQRRLVRRGGEPWQDVSSRTTATAAREGPEQSAGRL